MRFKCLKAAKTTARIHFNFKLYAQDFTELFLLGSPPTSRKITHSLSPGKIPTPLVDFSATRPPSPQKIVMPHTKGSFLPINNNFHLITPI